MWQEIIVGLMVAVSALFIGRRFWNNFKAAKNSSTTCGCGCSTCGQSSASQPDCSASQLKDLQGR